MGRNKIKAMFEKLGKQIVDVFNNMVDKYQKLIIDALKKDGKVILEEGQTLLIAVLDEGVKLAVDLIHKIAGNDLENEANGIKDLWQKLIDYLNTHGGKFGKAMANILKAYKVRIANMIKKVLSSGSEDLIKLIHEVREDLVKIIHLDPITAELDYETNNGIEDLWKKIKAAVEKFALKEKAEFEKFGAKYQPKFEALLKRFEATLVKEGKGLGKGLLLDILQEIIKIIIGGNDVEPMQRGIANGIKDLWQKLIDYLDTHGGKFGKAMANILKAYKVRIEDM